VERDSSDQDGDSVQSGRYDVDDTSIVTEGRRAAVAERRSIVALVKRYYIAAAAGDGAEGCALVYGYSLVAETTAEIRGEQWSSPHLDRKRCAAVLSHLYRQRHAVLAAHAEAFHVTDVRVTGQTYGVVILRFGPGREHLMYVRRMDGIWKIGLVFEDGMA
jgi:hypothetical protein